MLRYKNQTKQIIILRHNGGQLCNQLMLFTSVYAYCLEKGYDCINPSFYEYHQYFNFHYSNLSSRLFNFINILKFYKSHTIMYAIYSWLARFVIFFQKGLVIKEDPQEIFYLPPSPDKNKHHIYTLKQIESKNNKRIYIDGWTFRNPIGLKKYRKQIIKTFQPREEIIKNVQKFIKPLKTKCFLVGIHIRQGGYKSKNFMGGTWYFNEKEVRDILEVYLKKERKNQQKILFIICSDGPVNLHRFSSLNVKLGIGSVMEDLLTLSMCNVIIGSNSTFGSWAAYIGSIPFFIFDREKKYIKLKGDNLF